MEVADMGDSSDACVLQWFAQIFALRMCPLHKNHKLRNKHMCRIKYIECRNSLCFVFFHVYANNLRGSIGVWLLGSFLSSN